MPYTSIRQVKQDGSVLSVDLFRPSKKVAATLFPSYPLYTNIKLDTHDETKHQLSMFFHETEIKVSKKYIRTYHIVKHTFITN